MFQEGRGVESDDEKAVHWYRLSAKQDYASALNNLGWMYQHGRGVPKDYAQAVKWYRQAAKKGDEVAQNNLGWMYQNGHGVQEDLMHAPRTGIARPPNAVTRRRRRTWDACFSSVTA